MLSEGRFYHTIKGRNISDIIEKIYLRVEENQREKKDISNEVIYKDDDLGTISYKLFPNEIKILFSDSVHDFSILRQYICLENEKNDQNKVYIFKKSDLERAFQTAGKSYYFLIGENIINDMNEILNIQPSTIKMRKIEDKDNDITLDIFKSLNNKKNISREDSILIDTNELISQDIDSLGIFRDQKISLVLSKRNELINEIKNFMEESEEVIMKIYGVDGIGKSLTLVYLTSLINDFKIIYFNLKEFYNKKSSTLINKFKFQLVSYYTEQSNNLQKKDSNIKETIDKNTFKNYIKSMQFFEKKIDYKNKINFWYLLDIFLEMISHNFSLKVLLIIDQYKKENDIENKLANLEKNMINNFCRIKLLIVSSLNDMRVKSEFIEILKDYSSKSKKSIQKIENNEDETISINEEKIDAIFEGFSQSDENNDDEYEKIIKLNEIDEEKNPKINEKKYNDKSIPENIFIDKI